MAYHTLSSFFLSFLYWIFLFNTNADTHKFYVSTTTVEFKSELKTLQIIVQVFTDDIETIVQHDREELTLDPDSDPDLSNKLIADYLKERLQFTISGKSQDYIFLGKEYKNDITKCYIELKFDEVPNQIELYNGLFFSLFEEQQNIVHYKNSNQRKSFLLHRKSPSVTLDLTSKN